MYAREGNGSHDVDNDGQTLTHVTYVSCSGIPTSAGRMSPQNTGSAPVPYLVVLGEFSAYKTMIFWVLIIIIIYARSSISTSINDESLSSWRTFLLAFLILSLFSLVFPFPLPFCFLYSFKILSSFLFSFSIRLPLIGVEVRMVEWRLFSSLSCTNR